MSQIHQIRLRALELAAAQEARCFTGKPIEEIAQQFIDFIAPHPEYSQDPEYDADASAALMRSLPPLWSRPFYEFMGKAFPDLDKSSASWLLARLIAGVVECRKGVELRAGT